MSDHQHGELEPVLRIIRDWPINENSNPDDMAMAIKGIKGRAEIGLREQCGNRPNYTYDRGMEGEEMLIRIPEAENDIVVAGDWWGKNKRFQLVINDSSGDDPILHIRFNPEGKIIEILADQEIIDLMRTPQQGAGPWMKERDGE